MALSFGDFELDIEAAELRSGGKPVEIEPQVFDLIVLLATNAGRCVTKDEIIDTVWNGRIVSDSAISTRINAARRDGRAPANPSTPSARRDAHPRNWPNRP